MRLNPRRLATTLGPPLLLAIVGCPMRSAVWIVRGSTAANLEFGISDKRFGKRSVQWGGLAVYDCYTQPSRAQHMYWGIERAPEFWSHDWPNRVTYGRPPVDFRTLHDPEPLRPGCYEAGVSGTGHVAFVVDTGGGIRELPPTGLGAPPDTTRHSGLLPSAGHSNAAA